MSDKDKGGDKTELPTRKKLLDARKKGDIAKAKDITTAVGTVAAVVLFMLVGGYVATRIATFAIVTVSGATQDDYITALTSLALEAMWLLIILTAIVAVPLATIGLASEMFQTRGLFASKKLEPKLENLNLVEGVKRLFGTDGLIELVKTLIKVAAVVLAVFFVARGHVEQMGGMLLPATEPIWHEGAGMRAGAKDANLTFTITLQVLAWVAAVFVGVAVIDYVWSRQRFMKKMMMSRRDIKDEVKRDEGDPHMKGHRRQMAQEWAQSGAVSRTADASALLVNPTHLAIALEYDIDRAPVPVILSRGEGDVAAAMRDVALSAGVPIIRHVQTARTLWARGEVGEMVPEEMFDAIAEIILWARRARSGEAPMQCDLDANERDEAQHADSGPKWGMGNRGSELREGPVVASALVK